METKEREQLEAPATELLPESGLSLYEIRDGAASWWVIADDPSEGLSLLYEVGSAPELWPGENLEILCMTLEQANSATFDRMDGTHCRMATAANEDESVRIVACSEY